MSTAFSQPGENVTGHRRQGCFLSWTVVWSPRQSDSRVRLVFLWKVQIAVFVSNALLATDAEQVATKFQRVFALPHGVAKEMGNLQNDIELKAKWRDSGFWRLASREKFPLLTEWVPTNENNQDKVQELPFWQTPHRLPQPPVCSDEPNDKTLTHRITAITPTCLRNMTATVSPPGWLCEKPGQRTALSWNALRYTLQFDFRKC